MSNNGSQFAESKVPSTVFHEAGQRQNVAESARQQFAVHNKYRSSATGEMRSAPAVVGHLGVEEIGVGSKSLQVGDFGASSVKEKLTGLSDTHIHVLSEEEQGKVAFDKAQLPELTRWVPRGTSIVSRLSPNDTCALVRSILDSATGMTVDLRPATDKLKLKGVCYQSGSSVHFVITLYRSPDDEVVVVCEKQSGCPILFAQLFRLLLTRLGNSIVSQGISPQPPVFARPEECRVAETPFTLDPSLFHRAQSRFLDVQREAAISLVELFQGGRARLLGKEEQGELFSVAELFLAAESEELHRLGSVLLSNLLASKSVTAANMPKSLLARMIQMLESPSTYLNRDSKRQLETALNSIGKEETMSPEQRLALDERQRAGVPAPVGPPRPLSLSR